MTVEHRPAARRISLGRLVQALEVIAQALETVTASADACAFDRAPRTAERYLEMPFDSIELVKLACTRLRALQREVAGDEGPR